MISNDIVYLLVAISAMIIPFSLVVIYSEVKHWLNAPKEEVDPDSLTPEESEDLAMLILISGRMIFPIVPKEDLARYD